MKKIVISSLLTIGLLSSVNAYELNGNLGVKWTGFKTEKKAPVSGTFKDIKISIKENDDLSKFLTSSNVEIKTASFDSKNEGRDASITSTLFSLATSKVIKGKIKSVDEANKTLVLNVNMNEVSKEVPMSFDIKDGNIRLSQFCHQIKNNLLSHTDACLFPIHFESVFCFFWVRPFAHVDFLENAL